MTFAIKIGDQASDFASKILSGEKVLTVRRTEYEDGYYHFYNDDGGIFGEGYIERAENFILKFRGKELRVFLEKNELGPEELKVFIQKEGLTLEQFYQHYWSKTNQGSDTYIGKTYLIKKV